MLSLLGPVGLWTKPAVDIAYGTPYITPRSFSASTAVFTKQDTAQLQNYFIPAMIPVSVLTQLKKTLVFLTDLETNRALLRSERDGPKGWRV